MRPTPTRSMVAVLGVAFVATSLATTIHTAPVDASSAPTSVVRPGESIQAAVDAAQPGATIVVRPGTYREQVTVTTDGITLRGRGAVLSPPDAPVDGACQEPGATGICVRGDVDADGNVLEPVRDVRVVGITARDFTGSGMFAYGVDGITATATTWIDNGGYGVFARRSSRITITNNEAVGNTSAGIYVGINPDAQLHITGNRSFGNREGLLLLDSVGGTIAANEFSENCVGILMASSGQGEPGRAADLTVVGNRVRDNDRACGPIGDVIPPLSGAGIVMAGTDDVLVLGNTVRGSRATGPTAVRSGISVLGVGLFGPPGTGNRIIANRIDGNEPIDLELAAGGEVEIAANRCDTSDVEGACREIVVPPPPGQP